MTPSLTAGVGERIAVVAGLRTPFARQATAYRGCSALALGSALVNELVRRADLDPVLVDLLVFGQVIQMPLAPNIAREIALLSPLPASTDAYSVSRACATSFQGWPTWPRRSGWGSVRRALPVVRIQVPCCLSA